jgi:hypothetical protein
MSSFATRTQLLEIVSKIYTVFSEVSACMDDIEWTVAEFGAIEPQDSDDNDAPTHPEDIKEDIRLHNWKLNCLTTQASQCCADLARATQNLYDSASLAGYSPRTYEHAYTTITTGNLASGSLLADKLEKVIPSVFNQLKLQVEDAQKTINDDANFETTEKSAQSLIDTEAAISAVGHYGKELENAAAGSSVSGVMLEIEDVDRLDFPCL